VIQQSFETGKNIATRHPAVHSNLQTLNMWPKSLYLSIASLLLSSHQVHALNGQPFLSTGQINPCAQLPLLNTTSLTASFSPSNSTLALSLIGTLPGPDGNATLSIAIIADDNKAYNISLDPCSAGIAALCPASEGEPVVLQSNFNVPAAEIGDLDLDSRANVTFQLGIDVHGVDQKVHSSCVETVLRSGGSEGGGGSDSGNATVGDGGNDATNGTSSDGGSGGDDNGTTSDAGTNTNGTTQGSSANALQATSYLSM
jgi:hypothetical protein